MSRWLRTGGVTLLAALGAIGALAFSAATALAIVYLLSRVVLHS